MVDDNFSEAFISVLKIEIHFFEHEEAELTIDQLKTKKNKEKQNVSFYCDSGKHNQTFRENV